MTDRPEPREVIAEVLLPYVGEADLYVPVDKIINALRRHGYGIVTDTCVTCGEQIDGICDRHGWNGAGIDLYLHEVNEVTEGGVFAWVQSASGPDPSPDLVPEDERYQAATEAAS